MARALPASRVPDPMAAPPLRWGIIGTGWIAERFVAALRSATRQQVTAVGSRTQARADEFAQRLSIERAAGDYAQLADSSDIDVVYVATEHPAHLEGARTALLAGKPVLVEKPLAVSAAEATELAGLAAERQLFAMEALWTFFLPKFDIIRQLLDSGALGEINAVMADNGEDLRGHRRVMDPAMAGGPMLDLGTYVFALATWVLGAPSTVLASGRTHPSGVNGQLSAVLSHAADSQSVLHATVLANTPTQAFIAGSQATLVLDGPFYQPGGFEVRFADGDRLRHDEPAAAHQALFWQAAEVARCIRAGSVESPLRPLGASVQTLSAMDEVRRQLGIRYPGE